jgi:site-specific recombinase XerD
MANDFAYHVEKYFAEYLPLHIGASANTLKSYRDAFVQLLGYAETARHVKPGRMRLDMLTTELIEDFLLHLEEARHVSVSTRNQRLAAIHSFASYLQRKEPSCFNRCAGILAIPFKRKASRQMSWMSIGEMEALFSAIDTSSSKGLRELAVIVMLYETAARVQELADLTVSSFHLGPGLAYVELRGKGGKARRNPLGEDAVAILKQYLAVYEITEPAAPVFTNNRGEKLTRAGIQHIASKCIREAKRQRPELYQRKYSCHSFRHSKAMHLLEAEVNLIYIRDFLGHSSVTTTEIYAKTNPEIKRRIIEQNELVGSVSEHYTKGERDDLLEWLRTNL